MSEKSPCGIDGLKCDTCTVECPVAQSIFDRQNKSKKEIFDLLKEGKTKIDVLFNEYRANYINVLDDDIVNIGFLFKNKSYNVRFNILSDQIKNLEIAEKTKVGYGEYKKIEGVNLIKFIQEVLKKYGS